MDIVDKIMAYEQGDMTYSEEVALFQELLDTGQIAGLQGHYQRHMQALIEAGEVTR